MGMIGKMNTRIMITKRKEIGDFSDIYATETVTYENILDTWAEADYLGGAQKYNGRGIGKDTGSTSFLIRNPHMDLEKDNYIDAKGYRYQIESTRPADGRHRFIEIICNFIGRCEDEA